MKSHEDRLQLFSSYNSYILFHRMYSYEKIDKTVGMIFNKDFWHAFISFLVGDILQYF